MEVRIQLMEAQEFREWADRAWVAAGALCRPIRPYEIGQLMGFAPICTQVIGPSENSRQGQVLVTCKLCSVDFVGDPAIKRLGMLG